MSVECVRVPSAEPVVENVIENAGEESEQSSLSSERLDVLKSSTSPQPEVLIVEKSTKKASKAADVENYEYEEPIDPRVQVELENLNTLTDLINKLELELDDSRASFRHLLSDSSQRISVLASRLGSCVEKAKPYYESRINAKKLQNETQKAAVRYERATSSHMAAKEMVCLSEEGLTQEGRIFDPAWQEMLNHATMKVNDAERERVLSEREHLRTSKDYNEAERQVAALHKQLKRSIVKASLSARRDLLNLSNLANQHQLQLLPYFEAKAQFNQMMDEQIQLVRKMETSVAKAKRDYASALKRLESISYEIHERRKVRRNQCALEERGIGVGAESPSVPSSPQLAETLRKIQLCKRPDSLCTTKSPSSDGRGTMGAPPNIPWFYSNSSYSSSRTGSERDDCESVASGDTLDTLDESTIEKLMLEASIEHELQADSLSDKIF